MFNSNIRFLSQLLRGFIMGLMLGMV